MFLRSWNVHWSYYIMMKEKDNNDSWMCLYLYSVSFPLDQVMQFTVDHLTVQDLFHDPFFFSVYNFWEWGRKWVLSLYKVFWCGSQLNNIEDWVQSTQSLRQYALFPTLLTIGKGPNLWWESFLEGLVRVQVPVGYLWVYPWECLQRPWPAGPGYL